MNPRATRIFLSAVLGVAACFAAAVLHAEDPAPDGKPTIVIPELKPQMDLKIVTYGDMRFTNPEDESNTNPRVRKWLAEKVGQEHPDLLLLSGDLPFYGSNLADWNVYRQETQSWTQQHLRVFSTIGNHEMYSVEERGTRYYFDAFPELHGAHYYSVLAGSVMVISADTTQSTAPESPQGKWIDSQLANIPADVDYVFLLCHMPLMADVQSQFIANLPEADQYQLRRRVEERAAKAHARFIVINGHIHNYERFLHGGVMYLVTGGGGAKPYPVLARGEQDLYKDTGYPVFHYLVLELHDRQLNAKMYKVIDPGAATLSVEVKDSFTIVAKAPAK